MTKSTPTSSPQDHIGKRIRAFRKKRALTLIQLGELSGVSRAALSKIERGEISPTYSTLRKVALGLNLTIADLISESRTGSQIDIEVMRANESGVFGEVDNGYRLLAGQAADRSIKCFTNEVREKSMPKLEQIHTHATEAIVLVLNGRIICHFEDREPIELNEGDSLFYRGSIPHAFTQALDIKSEIDASPVPPQALWISRTVDPIL